MGKIDSDEEANARLEAALYSAGRPLTIEELIKASGTESRTKTLALMTNIVKKTTTEKFQKYFGIQGDKDLLKQKLFSKVRSTPQQTVQENPQPPAVQV